MGDNDDSVPPWDVEDTYRPSDIQRITERRLRKDPLQNVRSRRGTPAEDYERLMTFIDEVGDTIGCPDFDIGPTWALIVRL